MGHYYIGTYIIVLSILLWTQYTGVGGGYDHGGEQGLPYYDVFLPS